MNAEDGEEVAADRGSQNLFPCGAGAVVERGVESGRLAIDREEFREHRITCAQVLVVTPGEQFHLSTGRAAHVATPLSRTKNYQGFRIGDGQIPEQKSIDEAEDCGVGPNPQRQRNNCGCGKTWVAQKGAVAVAKVADEVLHGRRV